MGEAKRKREHLRAFMLVQMEKWLFPPSEWEREMARELAERPVVQVQRWPPHVLEDSGMPANHCHANTRWYADNDPEKKARQVTGWWKQEGAYVLHSIVERDGKLACITPTPYGDDELAFIPDPQIEWRANEADGVMEAFRDGVLIEVGVRVDPEGMIAQLEKDRAELIAAKNPYDVLLDRGHNV